MSAAKHCGKAREAGWGEWGAGPPGGGPLLLEPHLSFLQILKTFVTVANPKNICHLNMISTWLEEQGAPGEARRVILRNLKFDSNWKPKNRFTSVSMIHKSWIRLARISILIEWRRISDSRRLRKNLSGVNLRSCDGTTGT